MVSRKHAGLLIVILFAPAVYMETVELTPPVVDVVEGSNVTFTCKVMNYTTEVNETRWSESKAGAASGNIYIDKYNICSASAPFNNVSSFAWSCEGNSSFALTFKSVQRKLHMKDWVCYGNFKSSNTGRILVKVPVESVEMKSQIKEKITIRENKSKTFECTTTPSRPIPAIFWFLSNPEHLEVIDVTNEAIQSPQAGESINFTAVTSVLNYNFTRRFNGWNFNCQATNMPDLYVTSGQKLLYIMYPPDGFLKVIGLDNSSQYRIVEHEVGKLSCIMYGGNPLPTLTWSCFEGNVFESSENDSVSSTLTWTALRVQHDSPCTCVSEHEFGKSNVSTIVKVLCVLPTFH